MTLLVTCDGYDERMSVWSDMDDIDECRVQLGKRNTLTVTTDDPSIRTQLECDDRVTAVEVVE